MKQTCETCDWWCYGTYPDATCDKWEQTVYEVPVPDDVMARIMHLPTKTDVQKVIEEAEGLYD